jgi:hypothetical protein
VPTKTYIREQNGEAIINEGFKEMSRDQVMLQPSTTPYRANTILARITGGPNAGQWGKFDPAGANGLNVAEGYLYASRPASTEAQRATAITRDAELNGKKLTWDTATVISAPQIAAANAQLLAVKTTTNTGGIRVRY